MERKKIKNLIFPHKLTCLFCGREIFGGGLFCADCEKEVIYCGAEICERCGRRLKERAGVCSYCRGKTLYFSAARSPFVYKGKIAKLIKRMKFGGARYVAEELSADVAYSFFALGKQFDFIAFVPMTKEGLKKRGFNQSELIAKALAERTGLEVKDILSRKEDAFDQVGLGRKDRERNAAGKFSLIKKSGAKGKRILLVDDVLTTGATANEIARILAKAGAEETCVLTVCSTEGK